MQETTLIILISTFVAIFLVVIVVVIVFVANKPPAPTTSTPTVLPPAVIPSMLASVPTMMTMESYIPPIIEQPPEIVRPVDRKTLRLLRTESNVAGSCQEDSDCPGDSICLRGQLINNEKPYQNNLFEDQGYSIVDATTAHGRLYFILDKNKLGVVEPLQETAIYQLDMEVQQIVSFNDDIYLRNGPRLYRLDGTKLVDVPTLDIEYLSVTPDGKYLYINNTLFGTNFRSVLKLDKQPRVFLNPQTYLTLGSRPFLVHEGKTMSDVILPSVIVDAAFNKTGDLFFAEDKEKYRKINIISEEPFLLTRRVCVKR